MDEEALIRMANQITRNFAYLPEAEARAAVIEHLQRFWAPVMRQQLAKLHQDARLAPLARLVADGLLH